jgi:hypothetical protein
MSFRDYITPNKTKAEEQPVSLPSVLLTVEEAQVLLSAIKQATFKGEYAKEVVSLIVRFEEHIAKFK